jgi:hypothetical protein
VAATDRWAELTHTPRQPPHSSRRSSLLGLGASRLAAPRATSSAPFFSPTFAIRSPSGSRAQRSPLRSSPSAPPAEPPLRSPLRRSASAALVRGVRYGEHLHGGAAEADAAYPDSDEVDGTQMAASGSSASLKHLMLVGEKAARSPDVPRWDLPTPPKLSTTSAAQPRAGSLTIDGVARGHSDRAVDDDEPDYNDEELYDDDDWETNVDGSSEVAAIGLAARLRMRARAKPMLNPGLTMTAFEMTTE